MMHLRLTLCSLAAAAALMTSASPLLETANIRANSGLAYIDRQGAPAFDGVFTAEMTGWKMGNFEEKLSMKGGVYEGETAFIVTLEGKNCDTAWDLVSSKFDVIPGMDFTLNIRARGTVSMEKSDGFGDGYATAVIWYDAQGKILGEHLFNYGFSAVPDKWTDNSICGTVPPKAAKAVISMGGDSPNFDHGDVLAVSRIAFLMCRPNLPCMTSGTFTSVPIYGEEGERKLSWDIQSAFSMLNFWDKDIAFQVATAPDDNGRPGKWSEFTGPDGTEKTFYTSNGVSVKGLKAWARFRATLFSNGARTPLLKSVTLGNTTCDRWTVGDATAPQVHMVTESPNSHPEQPITFTVEDDSPLDMTAFRCFFDGEDVTAKLVQKGNTFSYQEECGIFRANAVSMSPQRWKHGNYEWRCAFEPLADPVGALRVKLSNKPGDTSFVLASMPLPVMAGKEYTFGFQTRYSMKLEKKKMRRKPARIEWLDKGFNVIGTAVQLDFAVESPDWTLQQFKATVPDGVVAAKISVGFDEPDIPENGFFDLGKLEMTGPVAPPLPENKAVPNVHTLKIQGKDLCGNAFSEQRAIFYGEKLTKNLVTMRDDGFVLIDGKPFFPRGFYAVTPKPFNNNSYDVAFKEMRRNGFNFAHAYCGMGEVRTKLLKSAGENGIKVWLCTDGDIYDCILHDRNHPAMLAWYLGDDTSGHIPADVVRKNHLICHALDNAHLTTQADVVGGCFSSRYAPYVHSTDSFLPEIYPMLKSQPSPGEVPDVISQMETIKADIRRKGSPVKSIWAIIQHFKGWGFGRFPSFQEQRAMTYLAIIHGAHGLTWYTYGGDGKKSFGVTSSPERWEEICIIGRELEALDHALAARNAAEQPTVSVLSGPEEDVAHHPSVSGLLKANDGKKIFFTANSSSEAVKASWKLKGYSKANVLFENREVMIDSNGCLIDDYAPLGVHVYELQ